MRPGPLRFLSPSRARRWAPYLAAWSLLVATVGVSPAGASDLEVNIVNTAPTVLDVTLPSLELTPTAGSTTATTTTLLVEDLNGCDDLASAAVTILKPDGSVHIAESAATYQSCTGGTTATYTYTFNMNFYDSPALDTTKYKVKAVATDSKGATGDNLLGLTLFNYLELVALNVGSATVDYGGPLNPGDTSSIVQLSIQNHGNVRVDTELSGADMAHATEAATIPVSSSAYSLNSDMSASSALSATAASVATGIFPGASQTATVYWRLTVPSGEDQWVPSGDYTGDLTISAVKAA